MKPSGNRSRKKWNTRRRKSHRRHAGAGEGSRRLPFFDSACGMAAEFYLDAVGGVDRRVVIAQYLEYFRAAEFGGHLVAFREPFAQLRTRDEQALLFVVRTGARGCHAAALIA